MRKMLKMRKLELVYYMFIRLLWTNIDVVIALASIIA